MHRERMHATGQFLPQGVVDRAMPLESALAAEDIRHNINAKMGLAAWAAARMPLMQARLVFDPKADGCENLFQLFLDDIFRQHLRSIMFGSAYPRLLAARISPKLARFVQMSSLEGYLASLAY